MKRVRIEFVIDDAMETCLDHFVNDANFEKYVAFTDYEGKDFQLHFASLMTLTKDGGIEALGGVDNGTTERPVSNES